MAARSFLLDSQLNHAQDLLKCTFPEQVAPVRSAFSKWLEENLLERLSSCGDFAALHPVLLGSWSRGELCPKSDIDILFAGTEAVVQEFVHKAFRDGLKLRSRTPKDLQDWRVGVEPFDILALFKAKANDAETEAQLSLQRPLAFKKRHEILRAIRKERLERHQRQDSISSYLEPNLKYGVGGLRDIETALAIRDLFPEKFRDLLPYPFEVLKQIKEQLLYLRCQLHVMGSGDILSAADQFELAQTLQMESASYLMKHVQKELERASFYADWACANALASKKRRQQSQLTFSNLSEAIQCLNENPNLLLQFEIRLQVDKLAKNLSAEERGKLVARAVAGDVSDEFLLALYRSRILEVLIPDLKKLKGLVQHDHYHRFTADAHIMQTLREVQRLKTKKRSLGAFSRLTEDLTTQEWWLLKLTALFHDLAKGRKGHHSSEGAKLVAKYFKEWGYSDAISSEVQWLVENHLVLSTGAFRQNPQAQSTWKRLFERGVHGRRLILLALFTAIDIRATNPEAWTQWKSQLLMDLVERLRSPEAVSLHQHLRLAQKDRRIAQEWLLKIDPIVLQSLAPKVLLADLKECACAKSDLPPKVIRSRDHIWVRFHHYRDETGLFLSFVRRLFGLGLNIQTSSVSTLCGLGVYDWFCLKTDKNARQISKWLSLPSTREIPKPNVQFQSIDLMVQDQDEWIFSFRGRDQRGLLLAAAQALVEENLSLRWARVHTWGQQIDDIFSVQPLGEVDKTLEKLRSKFVT